MQPHSPDQFREYPSRSDHLELALVLPGQRPVRGVLVTAPDITPTNMGSDIPVIKCSSNVVSPPSNTMTRANTLRESPPFLNEEKNPGPTCNPIEKTNNISPKSLMKSITSWLTAKPKWPMARPTNSTNVIPSEIPDILIFPKAIPKAITKQYIKMVCATVSFQSNSLIQSMRYICCAAKLRDNKLGQVIYILVTDGFDRPDWFCI